MSDHYQTKHIKERVEKNANDACTLARGFYMAKGDDPEPCRFLGIKPQLNQIFEAGGRLVMETYQNWDDEGGECYEAWIIAAEFAEEYNAAYDTAVYPGGDAPVDLMFVHRYIAENHDKFWHLWAGPY